MYSNYEIHLHFYFISHTGFQAQLATGSILPDEVVFRYADTEEVILRFVNSQEQDSKEINEEHKLYLPEVWGIQAPKLHLDSDEVKHVLRGIEKPPKQKKNIFKKKASAPSKGGKAQKKNSKNKEDIVVALKNDEKGIAAATITTFKTDEKEVSYTLVNKKIVTERPEIHKVTIKSEIAEDIMIPITTTTISNRQKNVTLLVTERKVVNSKDDGPLESAYQSSLMESPQSMNTNVSKDSTDLLVTLKQVVQPLSKSNDLVAATVKEAVKSRKALPAPQNVSTDKRFNEKPESPMKISRKLSIGGTETSIKSIIPKNSTSILSSNVKITSQLTMNSKMPPNSSVDFVVLKHDIKKNTSLDVAYVPTKKTTQIQAHSFDKTVVSKIKPKLQSPVNSSKTNSVNQLQKESSKANTTSFVASFKADGGTHNPKSASAGQEIKRVPYTNYSEKIKPHGVHFGTVKTHSESMLGPKPIPNKTEVHILNNDVKLNLTRVVNENTIVKVESKPPISNINKQVQLIDLEMKEELPNVIQHNVQKKSNLASGTTIKEELPSIDKISENNSIKKVAPINIVAKGSKDVEIHNNNNNTAAVEKLRLRNVDIKAVIINNTAAADKPRLRNVESKPGINNITAITDKLQLRNVELAPKTTSNTSKTSNGLLVKNTGTRGVLNNNNSSLDVEQTALNGSRKVVILSTTNAAFLDFTDNWLASIRKIGIHPNITIVAEDKKSYDHYFRTPDIHVMRADQSSVSEKLVFDTPEYKTFVNKRAQYILDLLLKGYDVLFSDVDTFWLSDPFPYFEEDYDIFTQLDQGYPDRRVLCAGFVYYKSNRYTIKFVKLWIKKMNRLHNVKPDQVVMNLLMYKKSVPRLRVKVLDPEKFLSGRYYFDAQWRRNNPHVKPVMLHNNWIIGHDRKVERFKNLGMWLT